MEDSSDEGASARLGCGEHKVYLDLELCRVNCKDCAVKNEKLDLLSPNTRYTLRFAMRLVDCRAMTIQDVARRMHLYWETSFRIRCKVGPIRIAMLSA